MKDLIKKIKILFSNKYVCEGCNKRTFRSMHFKSKYLETQEKLQESEEILNLALTLIDLNKVKENPILRRRYNKQK